MLNAIKQYFWAIALILLAACGPVQPISPVPVNTLTFTPIPSNAITPSPQPPLTATLALTPVPTGTNWPLGMEVPIVESTPTALATPDLGIAEYRLKSWSKEAALGLVNVAEQYSYADNVGYFGDDRFNYIADQAAVRAAALEAIKRYPDAEYKERLEWRIALADAMLSKQESSTWILQQVQDGLNSGRYTLENLDVSLNPYGFGIDLLEPIPNLLGRGQPGQLLLISISERPRTFLYAALNKSTRGNYKLMKIQSSWSFNRGEDSLYETPVDHTGDGIPEIVIAQRWWNGSYCGGSYQMFQWKKDTFINLNRDQFSFDECSESPGTWEYGPKDASGAQTIDVHEAIGYTSHIMRFKRYKWNGERYQLAESLVEQPERLDAQSAEWMGLAMGEGNYALLSKELSAFLSPPDKVYNNNIGPSFKDYVRFQLALAYALNGQSSKARTTLQQIIEKPDNPSIKALSDAAKAYLQAYEGQADVYRACQEALVIMNKAADGHIYDWHSGEGDQFVIQAWGYDPGQLGYNSTRALCSLDNAFIQLVKSLKTAQFEQAPEKLREAGVLIHSEEQLDLDSDGQSEWLIVVDTPGDDATVEAWVLLNSAEKVGALPLVSWERKKYELPRQNTNELLLEIKTVLAPDGKLICFLKLGTSLYTFQLSDGALQLPYTPGGVESYTIRQNKDKLELEITHTADSFWNSQKQLFAWSTQGAKWVENNDIDWDELHAKQSKAETALLVHWQPEEAIPLLQNLLEEKFYGEANYEYLLGLAYELKGDEKKAVEIYLNLWRNHADTVYARLVQEKLEKIK